jgi:hypothetical protein
VHVCRYVGFKKNVISTAKAVVQMLTTAMWRDKNWVPGCTVRVSISYRDRGFISSPESPDRL